jgi:hypothetical protein
MVSKNKNHYLRIHFSLLPDGSPEIYDFLFNYLPRILRGFGNKKVRVEIERLEPLNKIFTNLDLSEKLIKKALERFARFHHLKKTKNKLIATLSLKETTQTFKDYNKMFDLFFSAVKIKSKNFEFDLMDGFNNSILVKGSKKDLEKLIERVKPMLKMKARFEFADPR